MLQCWIENCSVKIYWNDSCRKIFLNVDNTMTQLLLRSFIPLKSEQVNVESSIFLSKFDNLIANCFMLVTFIFPPVLKQKHFRYTHSAIVCTIQTPISERFYILKKHKVWFFTRVHLHESLVFSKVWACRRCLGNLSFRVLKFKSVLFLCLQVANRK